MECGICYEQYDHSIRKPHLLSSCGHTYCLSCLKRLVDYSCPTCKKVSLEKYPNTALIEFIPESNYDKLKSKILHSWINLNQSKQDLKTSREEKIKQHQTKLKFAKQVICEQTTKAISILRQNESTLMNKCDLMLNYLNTNFDENSYENDYHFEIRDDRYRTMTKEIIDKNVLNENELSSLNKNIFEINSNLNKLIQKIKSFEINFEFTPTTISNDELFACKIDLKTNNRELEELLNQKDLSCYYYDRGNYLNDLKLYEEAIQYFDKAIEMRPHQSYLYNCKGVALCELNECEEALLLFDKSIGINPNQSTSYHYKADALLKLGRYKLAIQNYDTAIKMNPNLTIAINNRDIALRKINNDLKQENKN